MTASELGNRSVVRALDVLELLAYEDRPMSLSEVAKTLGLPKSSVLNLVRALTVREFAALDDEGRYTLGSRSFEVGSVYLRRITPVSAAGSMLRELTEKLEITSHFAVLHDDEVVYLAKEDPPGSFVRLASSLGARLPAANTAVGKAQLAHIESPPISVSSKLQSELSQVREIGYAVDSGETASGIECVSAPVFDSSCCCGAIGVSYLALGQPDVPTVAPAVVAAAEQVSIRLGGRGL